MSQSSPESVALVALMRLRGVGRKAALRILKSALSFMPDIGFRVAIFDAAARLHLSESELTTAWLESEQLLEKSNRAGIEAVAINDQGYPPQLRAISDPPAVLFVKGSLKSLHATKRIAIVGTREPSPYGEEVARRSAKTAAERGFVIVSGLAHGCDTLGHKGCLEAGGIGVAVLAHGLEKVYPAANKELAAKLLDHGGALVSEYPMGMTPVRTAFAERDRIQSGLSSGVLVIETDVKGGTMHTVKFAIEQSRRLACIAHPAEWQHYEKTRGNQMLINEGKAVPIPDGNSLLQFLHLLTAPEDTPSVVTVPDSPNQASWNF